MKKVKFLFALVLVVLISSIFVACQPADNGDDNKITGIALNNQALTVNLNASVALPKVTLQPGDVAATADQIEWSSADTAKVTIEGNYAKGIALTATPVTLTATFKADTSLKVTCAVTVQAVPVQGVSLDKTELMLTPSEKATLVATVTPSTVANKNVTWMSSDPSVATVANGEITAIKAGTTTITATSVEDNTKSKTCAVEVVVPVAVSTVAELKAIGATAASMSKSYYLANNIDLSGEVDWLAIGRSMDGATSGDGTIIDFKGALDGKGHKITMPSSYYKDGSGETTIFGLFKTNYGTLKNIWLSGNCLEVGTWAGALVVDNFGVIKDCYFDINLTSTNSTTSYASAITINNEIGGTISNCVGVGTNGCTGSEWGYKSGLMICNNKNPGSCSNLYALGNPETELVIGWEINTPVEQREQKCGVKSDAEMKQASLYAEFDKTVWNVVDGQIPTLKVQA